MIISLVLLIVLPLGGYLIWANFLRPAAAPLAPTGAADDRLTQAGEQVAFFAQAAEAVIRTVGETPTSMDFFLRTGEAGSGLDPWGRPYRFHPDAKTRRLWFTSDGPDLNEGTADDVESARIPWD